MRVRKYDFDSNIETPSLPTVSTPSSSTDLTTKSYVDGISMIAQLTGSRGTPQNIVAGTGIAFTNTYYNNFWFVQGSGGAVTVTANPRIAAGSLVGQRLTVIGRSDTNTLTMADSNGLSLNGTWVGGADSVLELLWDGTNWLEIGRSE